MKIVLLEIGAMVIAMTASAHPAQDKPIPAPGTAIRGTIQQLDRGQPPAPPPRVVTDTEVIAALKNRNLAPDDMINIVGLARYLPPHALKPATLAAITEAIRRIQRESEERTDKMISGELPQPSSDEVELGEADFEHVIALTEVLINQQDAAGMDGLAEVVDYGNTPFWAMVNFGEEAVPALVKRARTDGNEYQSVKIQKSMDALEQMLESPTIRATLSPRSHAAIRQLAADRMKTLTGDKNWRLFAAAAYLAVATGDPQLRKQVEELNNNDQAFFQQGMGYESQQKASELIQQALDKFK